MSNPAPAWWASENRPLGHVADRGQKGTDDGCTQRNEARQCEEWFDSDRVAEHATEQDRRYPTEVHERDPRSEDARGHLRGRALLEDRDGRNVEEHVRDAEQT